jgi:hypothetical protein
MRPGLKALLALSSFVSSIVITPPDAIAADLAVTPAKKAVKRSRVVRDYDGTPIILRRARAVMIRGYDGAALALHHHLYEAIPVQRAIPARYLNGQPVRPTTRLLYTR